MNLIATIILAPLLALFVRNRRIVFGAVVGVWAAMLPPTTHMILLDQELDKRSMANTISFFAVNYVVLGVGLAIAYAVLRRRSRRTITSAVSSVASH